MLVWCRVLGMIFQVLTCRRRLQKQHLYYLFLLLLQLQKEALEDLRADLKEGPVHFQQLWMEVKGAWVGLEDFQQLLKVVLGVWVVPGDFLQLQKPKNQDYQTIFWQKKIPQKLTTALLTILLKFWLSKGNPGGAGGMGGIGGSKLSKYLPATTTNNPKNTILVTVPILIPNRKLMQLQLFALFLY